MGTTTGWRSRIVDHAEVAPGDLAPHPENWRLHPKLQAKALDDLLSEVGWVQDIIVNRQTGRVLDGHLRLELARKRNEPSVPVKYVEVSEAEERRILLTFDPVSALAVADRDTLDRLLRETGEASDAVQRLVDSVAARAGLPVSGLRTGATDPDHAPVVPDEADLRVQRGQLWALGPHRLRCGDAAQRDDLRALLQAESPALLFTDPPYGVDYRPDERPHGPRRRRFEAIANDALEPEAYREWLLTVLIALNLPPGAAAYVCHADTMGEQVRQAFREAGYHTAACIIWAKTAPVLGRGDYHWAHEPLLYGWRTGGRHSWYGDRRQTTVWTIPTDHLAGGDERRYVHPTQKPVALVERALLNSSRPGDVVLDPFLGSGSTLIGCERLGRRCYALELDPRYAQVAIERWERFTGERAEQTDG